MLCFRLLKVYIILCLNLGFVSLSLMGQWGMKEHEQGLDSRLQGGPVQAQAWAPWAVPGTEQMAQHIRTRLGSLGTGGPL